MLGLGGWQNDIIATVLKGGLEDRESIAVSSSSAASIHLHRLMLCQVHLAALHASLAFLLSSGESQVSQTVSLLYPMLETLPSLRPSHFASFIPSFNRLALRKPALFQPHFGLLLSFLGPRILPSTDAVSTPTDSKPVATNEYFEDASISVTFKSLGDNMDDLDEDKEAMMKVALEFMITLSEAKYSMVNDVNGWVAAIVRGCLEGMGTLRNNDLDEWLGADVHLCLHVEITWWA